MSDNATRLAAIPGQFADPDPKIVSQLPKGGRKDAQNENCKTCHGWHKPGAVHLSYVGAADTILMLIAIDPLWSWEPLSFDEQGSPRIISTPEGPRMWGKVTVCGKTVLGVGSCEKGKSDVEKELIGDLLRNCGKMLGVATKLWSKTDGMPTMDDAPRDPTPDEKAQLAAQTAAARDAKTSKEAMPKREQHSTIEKPAPIDASGLEALFAQAPTRQALAAITTKCGDFLAKLKAEKPGEHRQLVASYLAHYNKRLAA